MDLEKNARAFPAAIGDAGQALLDEAAARAAACEFGADLGKRLHGSDATSVPSPIVCRNLAELK
jgi:hypothetical protein